jgi:hypothetical protein
MNSSAKRADRILGKKFGNPGKNCRDLFIGRMNTKKFLI